jgi:hypothetical protein
MPWGIANCSHGHTSRHTWNCPQPKTDSVKEHQIRENFKGALTCQFPQARPSSPFPLTSTTATPRQFSNWSINLHEIGYECISFFRFGSQLNQSDKTIWDPFTMSEVLIRTDDLLFYELEICITSDSNLLYYQTCQMPERSSPICRSTLHIASTLITFVDEEKVWSSLPQGIRQDQVQDDGRLQKQMQRG